MGKLGPLLTAFDSPFLCETNTGLGNVLFQIASTYGICKSLNMEFNGSHVYEFAEKLRRNYGFRHGETIFRKCLVNLGHPVQMVLHETPNHHKLFDLELISKIMQKANFSLLTYGYLESYMYFKNFTKDICDLFSIDDNSKSYLESKYPFLFDPNRTMIAIHVRGGNSSIEIDEAYYKKAIEHMQKQYPTAEYVLFTNDETHEIMKTLNEMVPVLHRVKEREDFLELWAFSQTKHAICCFSTFSWWGSFLINNPDKTVLVPYSSVEYMKKTYQMDEEKMRNEYYPPQTIII